LVKWWLVVSICVAFVGLGVSHLIGAVVFFDGKVRFREGKGWRNVYDTL
jgi:hypothetical protein